MARPFARTLSLSLLLGLCVGCAAAPRHSAGAGGTESQRAVLLVPVPKAPSWHDFAFLAAVPAAAKANAGTPAVIALEAKGAMPREVVDYLRRYKPRTVYSVGFAASHDEPEAARWRALDAASADAAACVLASTFWQACSTAVVCRDDDYSAGLVASALAARLRAPLLFAGERGLSSAASGVLEQLGAKRAIVVGEGVKLKGLATTKLADARAALAWMRKQGLPVSYLAVTNPRDRAATVIRKLSLAAPLLAAARQGAVVPLPYETLWKANFVGQPCKGEPPKGTPKSKQPPRKGEIAIAGRKVPFVVTTGKGKSYCIAHIDLNGNGSFADQGEGPLRTGDVVMLAGKRCVVSMGKKTGAGKADIRVTWPCADEIVGDLKPCYAALGGPPEHLCIVGLPDTIPQAVVKDGAERDLISDLPLANTDDDLFAEIAVARLIAENACFATLYASRVVTCDDLLDPSWCKIAGQARWENTYARLFENVGFTVAPHHDRDNLKWLVKPAEGKKGKRARSFDPASPLTHVAALTHMAHSWWHDIGQTYDWDSDVLLAPTLVESGGCLTAALDYQADFRSVISRFLRNGAVGFHGNARPGIAYQEQLRLEFWNAVLAGDTIGQAHRRALNSTVVTLLETGQKTRGPNRYSLYIRNLFGDPAFRMHIPSKPRLAPARVEVEGDRVSVHAPAAWWPVRMRVPEDWKKWTDKDLYVLRGAGTYAHRHWIGAGYDQEETYVNASFRTAKQIKAIEQVQSPPKPLGWTGKFVIDEHAGGTRTCHWRVRLVDFDQPAGKIRAQVPRLDYRIVFAK